MGMFFKKKEKEMVFQTIADQDDFTLENQNGKIRYFYDIDIEYYLEDMFESPDQFVILTAPKTRHHVRYVQACMFNGLVNVQLGIVKNDGTHLYEKMCSTEECYRIFLDYFDGFFIPKIKEYKPVQF